MVIPMRPQTGFATRLRALRTGAGLTQAELASRAGMHLQSLVKLERAEREPAWASVIALAKALGVSCEQFIAEGEQAEPPQRPRGRPPRVEPPARKRRGRKRE